MTLTDASPAIVANQPVSASQIAEVATYLAQHFHGDNDGWRNTAQVAEALGLSVLEARLRLNATQIAELCDCRIRWGVYSWRVRA